MRFEWMRKIRRMLSFECDAPEDVCSQCVYTHSNFIEASPPGDGALASIQAMAFDRY